VETVYQAHQVRPDHAPDGLEEAWAEPIWAMGTQRGCQVGRRIERGLNSSVLYGHVLHVYVHASYQ
jgi:hypothetical protein